MKKFSLLLVGLSVLAFQEVSHAQRTVYSADNSKSGNPPSSTVSSSHRTLVSNDKSYKPVRSTHYQGHRDPVNKETYHRPKKTLNTKTEVIERTPSKNPAVSQKQLMEFVALKRNFSSERCRTTILLFEFLAMSEANQRTILNNQDFYCIDQSDAIMMRRFLDQSLSWF